MTGFKGVVFFVLALSGAGLTAQTDKVVPAYCRHYEGSSSNTFIASYPDMRLQVAYEGNMISTTAGMISAVAFRRDGTNQTSYLPRTLHRKITLDHYANGPGAMSGNFATNLTANAQKVFESSTVQFPASPAPVVTPMPFTLYFAFSKPFLYSRSKGHLIMEIMGVGSPNTYQEWRVDQHGESYGVAGMTASLGAACTGAANQKMTLAVDRSSLLVGGQLAITVTSNIPKATSMLYFLGNSCTRFGGLPLPFDLSGLGATNCQLYTSILITGVNVAVGGVFPPISLGIPNLQALEQAEVFLQAAVLAPGANPGGFLLSDGWRCLVWPATRPATTINSVGTNSSTATMGFMSRTPLGPVTRFFGALP